MLFRSGATTFLAAGTNTQILTLAGGVPTWANAPVTGITIADDTTTNATRYLTFTSATSGTITTENTSSTKLYYNPSTGQLNATTFAGSLLNALTIGTGLSGTSYNNSAATTIAISNTAVTAGSYTNANITVNADRKSTRLNSSHSQQSRMPSSA